MNTGLIGTGYWGKILKSKLERIFSHNGPALLHCNVDPNEDVIPMLLGGQTMDKMWPDD